MYSLAYLYETETKTGPIFKFYSCGIFIWNWTFVGMIMIVPKSITIVVFTTYIMFQFNKVVTLQSYQFDVIHVLGNYYVYIVWYICRFFPWKAVNYAAVVIFFFLLIISLWRLFPHERFLVKSTHSEIVRAIRRKNSHTVPPLYNFSMYDNIYILYYISVLFLTYKADFIKFCSPPI